MKENSRSVDAKALDLEQQRRKMNEVGHPIPGVLLMRAPLVALVTDLAL